MKRRLIVAALCLAALSLSCASAPNATAENQNIGAEILPDRLSLPGTERDLKFDSKMAKLDLENERKYAFHYKRGGTSIGFKIAKRGKKKNSNKRKRKSGMFLPLNSSSVPEQEVISYRVSRLLEVSHLFNPVTYYMLGPKATRRFRRMIRRREYDSFRQKNANRLRKVLRKNRESLFGVYKFRHKRSAQEVWRMVRKNKLKKSHFLARAIRASNKMPSDELVRLRDVRREKREYVKPRAAKSELARQLSTIFVIDMLTGQWDRFSGTNLEAIAHKDGRLQFIARDNGGGESSIDWDWYHYYTSIVSRFDQDLINRLKRLNSFLQGDAENYLHFTNKNDLRLALGFQSNTSFSPFVKKLEDFVGPRLSKLQDKYGDRIYFRK